MNLAGRTVLLTGATGGLGQAIARRLHSAGAPAACIFAAGEIGPVGGDPFLHGFTATVAVFPR